VTRYATSAINGESGYRIFFRTDFFPWKNQSKDSKSVCKFSSLKENSNIIAMKYASRIHERMDNLKEIWQLTMPKLLRLYPSTRFEESGILILASFATILIGVIALVYAILQWQKKSFSSLDESGKKGKKRKPR